MKSYRSPSSFSGCYHTARQLPSAANAGARTASALALLVGLALPALAVLGAPGTAGASVMVHALRGAHGVWRLGHLHAANTGGTEFFAYSGEQASFTVPDAVTAVLVNAVGGGGGSGGSISGNGSGAAGGAGGSATALISVYSSEILSINVGGQGGDASGGGGGAGGSDANGVYGGGNGGSGDSLAGGGGGAGGASSVVPAFTTEPLVVAGGGAGGGGGGGFAGENGGGGGAGGTPPGGSGSSGSGSGAGGGGTGGVEPFTNGQGGQSAPASSDGGGGGGAGGGQGSDGMNDGGGEGGGGGGTGAGGGGGGGAGSSYVGPSTLQPPTFGTVPSPANGSVSISWAAPVPSISASASPAQAVPGQAVTLTATLAGAGPAPTGIVIFDVNNKGGAPVTLNGSTPDQATLSTTSLPLGTNEVTVNYYGDSTYGAASSSSFPVNVVAATDTTTVASSLTPQPVVGQAFSYTATVTPDAGVPTGTVSFMDGAVPVANCQKIALTAIPITHLPQASCPASYAVTGRHSITATYSGNATFPASTSQALVETVGKASTATSLLGPSSTGPGLALTLTARVTRLKPGSGTALGTVAFKRSGSLVAGCTNVAVSSGMARCTTHLGALGSYSFLASYSGDASDASSVSGPLRTSVSPGYVVAAADGDVLGFGSASFGSDLRKLPKGVSAVALATDPMTGGYWILKSNGGVDSFGAPWLGSLAGRLGAGVTARGVAPGKSGGYYVLTSNGAVASFGAPGHGSDLRKLPKGVSAVALATDPGTGGYWILKSNGGVDSFDAPWLGSLTGQLGPGVAARSIAAGRGGGYDLLLSNGAVANFGAPAHGSDFGKLPKGISAVALATDPVTGGYWILKSSGGVDSFGAPQLGSAIGKFPIGSTPVGISGS